jgi:polar amino acid transport system substrate-binding protein
MKRWLRHSLLLVCVVLVAAFVASACGGEEEKPAAASPTPRAAGSPTASLAAGVPELTDGTLQVGSDISYAPIEFYEAGTENAMGLDIDLGNAIAKELGVKVEFENTGFDGIIPALQAERFDVIMSAMTITEARQKEIDFIPYFTAGTGILVEAGNPKNIQTLADLCGKSVAVQLGTIQVDQLNAQNEQCAEKISITTFDQNPLAVEQLSLGRADAVTADFPVAGNDARLSQGKLEVVGTQFEAAPYGIGVRKDSTELNAALKKALQDIMNSGKYDSILADWGLEAGSIK